MLLDGIGLHRMVWYDIGRNEMVGMVCNKTGKNILQKCDKVLELMNHIISGLTLCDNI